MIQLVELSTKTKHYFVMVSSSVSTLVSYI